MSEFRALKTFIDTRDNRHRYQAGDDFPSLDSAVLEFKPERIKTLLDGGFIEKATGLKNLKNDELKALLDEQGIEYDPKATKEVLINLLTDSE